MPGVCESYGTVDSVDRISFGTKWARQWELPRNRQVRMWEVYNNATKAEGELERRAEFVIHNKDRCIGME